MTCQLNLEGYLSVGGEGCGCDSSGSSNTMRGLSLACQSSAFQAIKSTDCAVAISTAGAPGQNWAELPVTLGTYELLSLKSSAAVKLRLYADVAKLAGVGASFPVTTIDTDPFAFDVDGTEVALTFAGASLSAVQIAAQINAAAALAGLDFMPASVLSTGQLQLQGKATGSQGSLMVTTELAAIGFPDADEMIEASGSDLDVAGAFLVQFGTNGPHRIQISGQSAKVEILAAGAP